MHKKILGSGCHTTLIISNKDMEDLIKIIKSLEDSGLLLKGVTESVQNEVKEQKGGFLSMLLGTLGLLGKFIRKSFNWQRRILCRKGSNIMKVNLDLMVFILETIYQ